MSKTIVLQPPPESIDVERSSPFEYDETGEPIGGLTFGSKCVPARTERVAPSPYAGAASALPPWMDDPGQPSDDEDSD